MFGTEWNDATDAPMSRNGCDTRNDVLARDLTRLVIDPGTHDCVVRRGVLRDPYTGRTTAFERGYYTSAEVQIDHLIPLAAAWDLGASTWPQSRRETFANDVEHELLAVDGAANQAKSDMTPGEWLPPNLAFHCEYSIRYTRASVYWQLPITTADRAAMEEVARSSCE
ncbi:HNH endonuclease family protein [Nocardioides ochotonae]|uniref:HNH endonuclease family protein n=1 Tax=Nocardioides ochotonae TaxID=2685869 RepID=UPI00140B2C53|nr:HNH endonuclease family protein [Nocardioides ochotonae]